MANGSYLIKAITKFAAAHSLREYQGDCARIHGHNWSVEAEVLITSLDKIGISMDFRTLCQKMREVADLVEHQYLNEIKPFDEINPTAENIAAWFYDKLKPLVNGSNSKLQALTIWETENYNIRYSE